MISAKQSREALESLRETASKNGAPFESVDQTVAVESGADSVRFATQNAAYEVQSLDLKGRHQIENAMLAIRLAETAWPGISRQDVQHGLQETRALSGIRARLEVVSEDPRIVLDVAHNLAGWQVAIEQVRTSTPGTLYILFGVMADKDRDGLISLLQRANASVIPMQLPGERSVSKENLMAWLKRSGISVIDVESTQSALAWYDYHTEVGDTLLVTGSHFAVEATLVALQSS